MDVPMLGEEPPESPFPEKFREAEKVFALATAASISEGSAGAGWPIVRYLHGADNDPEEYYDRVGKMVTVALNIGAEDITNYVDAGKVVQDVNTPDELMAVAGNSFGSCIHETWANYALNAAAREDHDDLMQNVFPSFVHMKPAGFVCTMGFVAVFHGAFGLGEVRLIGFGAGADSGDKP